MHKIKSRKRKVPKYFYLVFASIFLFLGVGYSLIYTEVGIIGDGQVSANSWNVVFNNLTVIDGDNSEGVINQSGDTAISINPNFSEPGEKLKVSFDITNSGTLAAKISQIVMNELTDEQKVYLDYSLTYEDGTPIEENDLIKSNQTKKAILSLEYKNLRARDYFPSDNEDITLTVDINFKQVLRSETKKLTIDNLGTTSTEKISSNSDSFRINSSDTTGKAIICNNGAKIKTDENNDIIISNIKQDTNCKITEYAKDALESADDTKNFVLQLANEDNNEAHMVLLEQTKNITYDLNGKTNNSDSNGLYPYIYNTGTLKLYSSKEGAVLQSNSKVLESPGRLDVENITIRREVRNAADLGWGATLIAYNADVKNCNIYADGVWALGIYQDDIIETYTPGKVNVFDTFIETTAPNGAIVLADEDTEVNFYNSTINVIGNNTSYPIRAEKENAKAYLCNTTVTDKGVTAVVSTGLNDFKLYYDNNSTFNNQPNPVIYEDANHGTGIAIKSGVACQISNK